MKKTIRKIMAALVGIIVFLIPAALAVALIKHGSSAAFEMAIFFLIVGFFGGMRAYLELRDGR